MKTTFTFSLKHLAVLLVLAVVISGCSSGSGSGTGYMGSGTNSYGGAGSEYPISKFNFSGQPTTNGTNNEVKS